MRAKLTVYAFLSTLYDTELLMGWITGEYQRLFIPNRSQISLEFKNLFLD